MNLEYAAVITSKWRRGVDPPSTGIGAGGTHKTHRIIFPASHTNLSAGSTGRYSGRIRRTFSRNQDSDPVQPRRSANTTVGMSGNSSNIARTRGSNKVNNVSVFRRSYLGGSTDAGAFTTVVRERPKPVATFDNGSTSGPGPKSYAGTSAISQLPSKAAFHASTAHKLGSPSSRDKPRSALHSLRV